MDEAQGRRTPPATMSSMGTRLPAIRGENALTAALLGLPLMKPRPSSSALPPVARLALLSTPPPPPKDQGVRSSKSPSYPVGGLYNHLMLSLEMDSASARVTGILKGSLLEDRRLMSSLSLEDLNECWPWCWPRGRFYHSSRGTNPGSWGGVHKEVGR
ncbi:UNVERIFIED_CONTAM: hypothetical protein Sradi_7147600 [Sesamum radiatum]|uniref:Uncharacterized protein n=1 Tax=Sesamum radiatum TaxID=300843 RepID=A0AAW2IWE1_SESRA